MNEIKLANPDALGLGAFALTTFLLILVNAGIIAPESIGNGSTYGTLLRRASSSLKTRIFPTDH